MPSARKTRASDADEGACRPIETILSCTLTDPWSRLERSSAERTSKAWWQTWSLIRVGLWIGRLERGSMAASSPPGPGPDTQHVERPAADALLITERAHRPTRGVIGPPGDRQTHTRINTPATTTAGEVHPHNQAEVPPQKPPTITHILRNHTRDCDRLVQQQALAFLRHHRMCLGVLRCNIRLRGHRQPASHTSDRAHRRRTSLPESRPTPHAHYSRRVLVSSGPRRCRRR